MKLFYMLFFAAFIAGCASNKQKSSEEDSCWGYVSSAIKLRSAGKYNESLAEIEKHNICDKSDVRMSYYYHKGWTLYEMGDYQGAVDAFTRGLETEPNYIYAYWRRGLAYEAMGDAEKAQESYRLGYEIGVKQYGEKFFEYMNNNPDVKEKLVQNWGA